ncbi:LysR family transcriptional regulator [Deltaproteobacteria bacterium]|nr:LysR family transcriptional regulator [Deltaproteobacteria bacterium]
MPKKNTLLSTLDWNLLETFRVIVEEGSISRAALHLKLTQSAVSHSLRRLEAQVEKRLLDRAYRHFQLTAHGRLIYEAASRIYREIISLDDSLGSEDISLTGTLRLLVLSRIVSPLFDDFLAQFRKDFPLVKLDMEMLPSTAILKQIQQNVAALGLALCRQEVKDIRRVLLIPEKYSLYCGKHHPLFAQKDITKEQLLTQNFVSFFTETLGDVLSPLAVFRDEQQFRGEVVASSNIFDEVKRMLYAGYGIGCLPDNAVEREVQSGDLRRLPLENTIAEIPIYLVWNARRKLKPVEKAFINNLITAFHVELDTAASF